MEKSKYYLFRGQRKSEIKGHLTNDTIIMLLITLKTDLKQANEFFQASFIDMFFHA